MINRENNDIGDMIYKNVDKKVKTIQKPKKKRGTRPSGFRKYIPFASITAAIAAITAIGYFALEHSSDKVDLKDLPVIKAEEGSFKIKPKDPGGIEIPYKDKEIYKIGETAGGKEEQVTVKDNTPDIQEIKKDSPEPKIPEKQEAKPVHKAYQSEINGYKIQLGAYRSREAAESRFEKIRKSFGRELKGLTYAINRIDIKGKGVFYRLQAGPFEKSSDAKAACKVLIKKNQDCITLK